MEKIVAGSDFSASPRKRPTSLDLTFTGTPLVKTGLESAAAGRRTRLPVTTTGKDPRVLDGPLRTKRCFITFTEFPVKRRRSGACPASLPADARVVSRSFARGLTDRCRLDDTGHLYLPSDGNMPHLLRRNRRAVNLEWTGPSGQKDHELSCRPRSAAATCRPIRIALRRDTGGGRGDLPDVPSGTGVSGAKRASSMACTRSGADLPPPVPSSPGAQRIARTASRARTMTQVSSGRGWRARRRAYAAAERA
jgi:hypothetical protein